MQRGCDNREPKRVRTDEMTLSSVVIEDGDFPEEPGWLLVGRTVITGLSTTKGRKLENNEIVHFAFPSLNTGTKIKTHFMSSKAAHAVSSIVRFSTKRNGEIGRLPMEWAKCLVPLVSSSKVKVLGRCIAAPVNLRMMQEILLYVSFYIHESVFSEVDKSWKLEATNIDATIYPLLKLFEMLKVKPSQKAQFTPEELDSRKRSLQLDDDSVNAASVLPSLKRIKGSLQDHKIHEKDEQVISESSLNKLVGAAEMYNLEEMEPSETLACDLRPYQKQALYWMSELEKGANHEEKEKKTLHPCWAAYRVCDERAPEIYVNLFSGEATTEFPTAMQMARGGILADAMGLGKTVMTIALILARRGHGFPDDQQVMVEDINNRRRSSNSTRKQKGGTLIVCPMALLSQWKDELEAHSKPDSITVFVHYGGDRTSDPKVIAEPDVVLTTYGVLTSAYKSENINSIYHRVEWHRVVLDEAHTIKSSKSQAAQAAFALFSYCRWCLTGTPLQNNLEDLFSLLCFLHVEPWCNWAWFSDNEDMLEDTWDFPRRPDISDGYFPGSGGYYPMWENYPIFQSRPKKQDTIGLADAITKSILSTGRIDLQRKLFCSMQLIGGGALTDGLVSAVEERVLHAIPSHEAIDTVEVLQSRTSPASVPWKGGAILGILDFTHDAWINREDWIRNGIYVGAGRKYRDSYFLQAQSMCYINS